MNNQPVYELNMDGLCGPTHHYAGLAAGNIASTTNALSLANPQQAALQGLSKMRFLQQMGLRQAILPPHQRPNLHLLHQLGFCGSPAQQISRAQRIAPQLLSACYSASGMWAANAATVSASVDTEDRRVHFTAANLISNLHRHQEAGFSRRLLQMLFNNQQYFAHHPLLPKSMATSDEGAANHTRLGANHGSPGLNLFVYGKQALASHHQHTNMPLKYPARQTLEASSAIARAHGLNPDKTIFARQNPIAIDAGVFHNDVIAVGNENLLLIHEQALVEQEKIYHELRSKADFNLTIVEVSQQQISLADAVNSYLFNSQLITLPNASMILVAPGECEENTNVRLFLEELIVSTDNELSSIHFIDVKQSMRNGGGPACLRLRVPLSEQELAAMHQGVILTDGLFDQLNLWIKKHYRTQLHADDLADPALINESFTALDELSQLLDLGSIYPFQLELVK